MDDFEQDAVERSCAPMLYFSHDSNAAEDIKCKRLIRHGGFEAYGRWWRLCELLALARGHTIHVDESDEAEILADDLGFVSWDDGCSDFVTTLASLGLIDAEMLSEGCISSHRMLDNATRFGARKAAAAKGGKAKRDRAMEYLTGKRS